MREERGRCFSLALPLPDTQANLYKYCNCPRAKRVWTLRILALEKYSIIIIINIVVSVMIIIILILTIKRKLIYIITFFNFESKLVKFFPSSWGRSLFRGQMYRKPKYNCLDIKRRKLYLFLKYFPSSIQLFITFLSYITTYFLRRQLVHIYCLSCKDGPMVFGTKTAFSIQVSGHVS